MNRRLLEPLVLSGPAVERDRAVKEAGSRDEAINEALYDAVCDGDGCPRADALAIHLAKRGLVVVEMNPPATPSNDIALTLKSTEAIWNAISRSRDGYPGVEIGEELAKRGLVIVEAARYSKLLAALQIVCSALEPIVTDMGATEFPPGVWRALRNVVSNVVDKINTIKES